jgi:hypothetical protein
MSHGWACSNHPQIQSEEKRRTVSVADPHVQKSKYSEVKLTQMQGNYKKFAADNGILMALCSKTLLSTEIAAIAAAKFQHCGCSRSEISKLRMQ